jgi:hypothetical protein
MFCIYEYGPKNSFFEGRLVCVVPLNFGVRIRPALANQVKFSAELRNKTIRPVASFVTAKFIRFKF